MKIGLVMDDGLDKPDGVQQYVLTVGRWLNQQGHEVHFLVGETKRKDIPNLHSLSRNVHVKFNQNRATIPLLVKHGMIEELLKREKFDLLHIQMPYSPLLSERIIKTAPSGTTIVATFHILPFGSFQSLLARQLATITKKTFKRIGQVMSTSHATQQFCKSTFGLDSIVVPNPVDIKLFKSANKIDRYNDGKLNIVFLGRLVERKGAMELLRAIKKLQLSRQTDNMRVIICGKGPLEPSLRRFCEKSGLSDIVEFAGFIVEEDKPAYLKTADIAVFPSLGGESFGIVLLEAMASGAGVVLAGNNPGYQSVLGDKADLLFDPKNDLEFANRLLKYCGNEQLRRSMHAWQQRHVKQFDIQYIGPKIISIYNQALRKNAVVR